MTRTSSTASVMVLPMVATMIAGRVGMGSAATLRRHFNRTVGVPPDTYRRTFRDARHRDEHQADGISIMAAAH